MAQTAEVNTFGATINAKPNGGARANCISVLYKTVDSSVASLTAEDKVIAITSSGTGIRIRDDSYNSNATSFKAGMSGVYLVYEKASVSTETAEPYVSPQIVDRLGTEEYVTTGIVPIGHNSKYSEGLKGKLEELPWNFSSLIAPTETTNKASRNYTSGSLLIMNNILYKATANIQSGGTITPNTNVTATTLSEVIANL